jgi:GTP-binding protein HflX
MFERPEGGERVLLVHVDFLHVTDKDDLTEFLTLVHSAGVTAMSVITANRKAPDAKYFIGSGKAEEIAVAVEHYDAECVIFNHSLSPSQQRNLERILKVRVLDRTQLILDIFAQRARTYEGKLQVELAQLQHLATRLVRGWTHLERQKGGIGLRGPGETQLETDRRLLRERIKHLQKRLVKVRKQREQGRQRRKRRPVPVVALVGYTNAGKSTLFNQLTNSDVYVADQLFATLDPTLRRLSVEGLGDIVLVDTVGFIRHLPHDLVDAFRATLEETREADLLLHLVDASDPAYLETIDAVDDVLMQIQANDVPQIKVYNKIDRLQNVSPHRKDNDVWLSAVEGVGFDLLLETIKHKLDAQFVELQICLTPAQANIRAQLHELKAVINEHYDNDSGWQLDIRLPKIEWERLQAKTIKIRN